jgi:predicted metal-binding protein
MGRSLAEGERAPGLDLFDEVAGRAGDLIELRPVTCLAACTRGCTAAIEAPGKWTTILGGLEPGLAADILDYAQAYAASTSGAVLPSRRAESLRQAVIARVPG